MTAPKALSRTDSVINYQVLLHTGAGSATRTVCAVDAFEAIKFAESLCFRSTAMGVVKLTPYVSA